MLVLLLLTDLVGRNSETIDFASETIDFIAKKLNIMYIKFIYKVRRAHLYARFLKVKTE